MDDNSKLLLAKAGQATRWEDEEKSTNNVDVLREEFRRRLYSEGQHKPLERPEETKNKK